MPIKGTRALAIPFASHLNDGSKGTPKVECRQIFNEAWQIYAAVQLPPTQWKAVDYSPARHSYFRMLYDWNSIDSVSGQTVSAMANADLASLSQNGFNLVRVYLWDQQLLKDSSPGGAEYSGFLTAPSDPSQSPNNQWGNLNSFVTMAESYGLFVALHFAAGPPLDTLNAQPPPTILSKVQAVAAAHVAWATEFIP